MDLVINHTSDEHEWFQQSRDIQSPCRDYYIWRPGRNVSGKKPERQNRALPPNNWTSFFMGSAWEYDEKSGEYYLHLFDKKQPDLNYKNPQVTEEVKNILRFWLDKGAAGFRCDVINIIYKSSLDDGKKGEVIRGLEHYKSQEGNHAVLRELKRGVLDKYGCFTVGETVFVDLQDAKLLCDESRKELDMLFFFDHLEVDRRIAKYIPKKFRARKLLEVMTRWQRGLDWCALYLENHDQTRIVSHYGAMKKYRLIHQDDLKKKSGEYWRRSAKMLALFELTLRGTPFIYQGQEIGMTNFDFESLDELNDVESRNIDKLMRKFFIPKPLRWKWIKASSRDNNRTPMQWDDSDNAGFSRGKPWLGINKNYKYINYASQKNDPDSILTFYRMLIALRRQTKCLVYGSFHPVYADDRIMIYQRKLDDETYAVALNFSFNKVKPPEKFAGLLSGTQVVSASGGKYEGLLLPWDGVLVRT
jgi:oligo-1,6-glucosidase